MRKEKRSQEDFFEGDKVKSLRAKTKNQKAYILSIVENDITFCFGPSGTGKSFVAAGIAAEHLNHDKTSQIIVTRPLVCAGKNLGAVPGEVDDTTEQVRDDRAAVWPALTEFFPLWGHFQSYCDREFMVFELTRKEG